MTPRATTIAEEGVYIDNVQRAQGTMTTNVASGQPLRIAASSVISNWTGKIDEIGMWSRVLSGTEMTTLYNSGNGLAFDNTAPTVSAAIAANGTTLGDGYNTALAQQQFHALGLIAVGTLLARVQSRWLAASGTLMLLGTVLFCFNLYARLIWGWDAARAAVPWGGSAFILSWLALGLGVWRGNRRD